MPSKKPRIIVWESHSYVSGGQAITLRVVDALKDDCDLLVLLPGEGDLSRRLVELGVPYFAVGEMEMTSGEKGKIEKIRSLTGLASIYITASKQVEEFSPDLIYAPGPTALMLSAICGTMRRIPVCWHVHHYFKDGGTARLLSRLSHLKSVCKVVAVARCVGERVVDDRAMGKLEVMRNPVDIIKFDGRGCDSAVVGEEFSCAVSHDIVLGHIAFISKEKNQEDGIELLHALVNKGADASLVWVGEIRSEEGKLYYRSLMKKAAHYGVADRVCYLGKRSDVNRLLPHMTFLLLPSFEGCSLAGLEANASGVPIVSVAEGGTVEMLDQGMAGISYFDEDFDSAADSIIDLHSDRAAYLACQEKGRAFAFANSEESFRVKAKNALLMVSDTGCSDRVRGGIC